MASSIRKPMTDAQKAASRQRIATTLGREYQGYKPGGDPRAAQRAVMAAAPRPAPTPMGGAAAPVSGMGGAGGTQQMIKKGGMTYSVGGMTPPKKPVTLQTRQFGTGPGMRPMPKHLGKAVTDRGRAILGKADGGMTKGSGRDGCAIRGKTRA